MNPDAYDHWIHRFAPRWGLDPRWVKAQLIAESQMDPRARSSAGALGLAQFMPLTWLEWNDGTPGIQQTMSQQLLAKAFNPKRAVWAHCAYMAWLLKKFRGDRSLAIAAYNYGIGAVKRRLAACGGDARHIAYPKETERYISRIERTYADLTA